MYLLLTYWPVASMRCSSAPRVQASATHGQALAPLTGTGHRPDGLCDCRGRSYPGQRWRGVEHRVARERAGAGQPTVAAAHSTPAPALPPPQACAGSGWPPARGEATSCCSPLLPLPGSAPKHQRSRCRQRCPAP
eukprot:scaffold47891_cov37-Phaeocystis_antarctica.AAC.1